MCVCCMHENVEMAMACVGLESNFCSIYFQFVIGIVFWLFFFWGGGEGVALIPAA